jgi:hypothetical protein
MGELMDQAVQIAGWGCIASSAASMLIICAVPLVRFFKRKRPPQVAGADLPALEAGLDLTKRYDIAFGASTGYGIGPTYEKLLGARILGYLRSDQDATTGEYADSRWLVVELPDGSRGYLRPRSVLWIIEASPTEAERPGSSLQS